MEIYKYSTFISGKGNIYCKAQKKENINIPYFNIK